MKRCSMGSMTWDDSSLLGGRVSIFLHLLWEKQFYEDGVEIAGRIGELVPKVAAEKVAALAVEARLRG